MRRTILISAAIGGVTMACVFMVIAAQAQGPALKLEVDTADSPLRINGVLDGQANTFSGNVRLTVNGGDAPQVRFLASDLRDGKEPETIIDRSSITTFPANISLGDGQPSDVKVTIGNVKHAGDYTGELQFWVSGHPLTQTLTIIPLELHVDAKPDVKPVVADQSFQVTRCSGIGCDLTEILLGGGVTREDWHVQLDNQASELATVTNAQAVMVGKHSAEAVTPSQVVIDPMGLPANEVSTVPVTIKRDSLLPDRYQGKLRFTIGGLDEPVTINSTLDVRDGPLWALVAIFLGIVVGRLARDMETPIAKKQVKLLPRWYELRTKIDLITDQPARLNIESNLQTARTKIDSATDTEEVASKFLDDLEAKVSFLIDLQTIEDNLKTLPIDQEQAKRLIEEARSFLLAGEAEKAEQVRKDIIDLIRTTAARAKADSTMGLGDDIKKAWNNIASRLSRPAEPSLTQSKQALDAANGRQASKGRRFLAGLSGLQLVAAETRYWVVRPVLSLVLLALLMLLGLQTLYVNSGATFGVGGLYDYLGLFLWGITADVAQRTLLNLPVARASA